MAAIASSKALVHVRARSAAIRSSARLLNWKPLSMPGTPDADQVGSTRRSEHVAPLEPKGTLRRGHSQSGERDPAPPAKRFRPLADRHQQRLIRGWTGPRPRSNARPHAWGGRDRGAGVPDGVAEVLAGAELVLFLDVVEGGALPVLNLCRNGTPQGSTGSMSPTRAADPSDGHSARIRRHPLQPDRHVDHREGRRRRSSWLLDTGLCPPRASPVTPP